MIDVRHRAGRRRLRRILCRRSRFLSPTCPRVSSPDAAAASLLKGMTAHYLIKSVYPVQQGDAVLVHAGAGGVGLILTQWATSLAVAVITTVSTPEKAELSRQAGAASRCSTTRRTPSSSAPRSRN